jgi:hypothetical protein
MGLGPDSNFRGVPPVYWQQSDADLIGLTFYSRQPSIPVFVSKKLCPTNNLQFSLYTEVFLPIQFDFSSKECDPTSVYSLTVHDLLLLRAIGVP